MTIEMKTQSFPLSIKAGESPRRFTFRISTGSPDRDRDVIDPKGWKLDSYRKNPVVLFAHDYKIPPIAKTVEIAVTRDGLEATCEFPPHGVYPLADTVYGLVANGQLRAASVGFKPTRGEYNQERKGLDIFEAELLEWSIVPVGANSDALLLKCVGIGCMDEKAMSKWLTGSGACGCDEVLSVAMPSTLDQTLACASDSLARSISRGLAGAVARAAFPSLDEADATPETVNKFLGQAIPKAIADIVRHEVHQAILYHTGRVD